MLICYRDKAFQQASLDLIDQANDILKEYSRQGYTLTLRQLYYQFVARDLIPNSQRSYNRLGNVVSVARIAGLISWTAIEDRGRSCHEPYIQSDPTAVLDNIEYAYSPDLWAGQDNYVEVWVEKDALSNVVARPAQRWQVGYLACKGYLSSSEAWRASQRFIEATGDGKQCHLIHLGDHDPSGIDMTRDNGDRLDLFEADVLMHRIALNYDQVERYAPPPNPAKQTDSRIDGYVEKYGDTSWELDALQPSVIEDLVDEAIGGLVDRDMMDIAQAARDEKRAHLRWISDNSEEVLDYASRRFAEDGE